MVMLAANDAKSFCSPMDSPCGGFMSVPALIRGKNGEMFLNPDFDYMKVFTVQATPFTNAEAVVASGASEEFEITVPAEENHLGDLLISELRAQFIRDDAGPTHEVYTEILSYQNDRLFQNAPIANNLLYTDGTFGRCLPCCMLLQATNSMRVSITNEEAVAVIVRIEAFGKRFLPYHYPELRERYLAFWNTVPCTPYYLTLDQGPVTIAPGATETRLATVPGGGDFEVMWPMVDVISAAGGTNVAEQVLIQVQDGVGRSWSTGPNPIGLETIMTRTIAGMPNGGIWRASQILPCPRPTQLFKRNTRVRVTFQNTGPGAVVLNWAIGGCMHYVGMCPPGDSLDRIRSREPTVGPLLIDESRCTPFQQMVPMPGQGFVPVGPPAQRAQQQPGYGQGQPILGPGYGAALGPGFLGMNGMGHPMGPPPPPPRLMRRGPPGPPQRSAGGQWRQL